MSFLMFQINAIAIILMSSVLSKEIKPNGVVVDNIAVGSLWNHVGLRLNDIIISFEDKNNNLEVDFKSPAHWYIFSDDFPKNEIVLNIIRNDVRFKIKIPIGSWSGISVRPIFPKQIDTLYLKGKILFSKNKIYESNECWEKLLNSFPEYFENDISKKCWLRLQIGNNWMKIRNREKSLDSINKSYELAENTETKVVALWAKFVLSFRMHDLPQARIELEKIIDIWKKKKNESLFMAKCLSHMGELLRLSGDFSNAERYFFDSLRIREMFPTEYLMISESLNNLGVLNFYNRDFQISENYFLDSIDKLKLVKLPTYELANSLNNIAMIMMENGYYSISEVYFLKAARIRNELGDEDGHDAHSYNNLGVVYKHIGDYRRSLYFQECSIKIRKYNLKERESLIQNYVNLYNLYYELGDLVNAERYVNKIISFEEVTTETLSYCYYFLGQIEHERKKLHSAKQYFLKSLDIRKSNNADKIEIAKCLINLGFVFRELEQHHTSLNYYNAAREILEKDGESIVELGKLYLNEGQIYHDLNNYPKALSKYSLAKSIFQKHAKRSYAMIISLYNLSTIETDKKFFKSALDYLRLIKELLRDNNPYKSLEKDIFRLEARIMMGMRQFSHAKSLFENSITSLENEFRFISLDPSQRTWFVGKNQEYYYEYVNFLLEFENPELGFNFLEKSRAQVLRELINENSTISDTSENLDATLEKRQRFSFLYQKKLNQIYSLTGNDLALNQELKDIQREYNEVQHQIREQLPKLASLRFPKAVDVPEIQTQLESGTLIVAFAVMEKETFIFTFGKEHDVQFKPLGIGQAQLEEAVTQWVQGATDSKLGPLGKQLFENISRELGNLLLDPIRERILKSDRLLIIPDGSLWYLPFGALPFPSENHEKQEYLIEKKPITTAVSASLYLELKSRPKRKGTKMVAIGDAIYPGETGLLRNVDESKSVVTGQALDLEQWVKDFELSGPDFRVRSVMRRANPATMKRIPHTAREVNKIAEIFGPSVRTFLRGQANEAMLKGLDRDTDILHIAAHGIVDNVRPMDSALVLTVNEDFKEGEENGILFAWEIFEDLRIDADLVVLSACESGLGKASGGEGLIGLTRAFQIAGARSILASYWAIPDGTTATFMEYFYTNLKAGMNKAEALRQAQISFIREPVEVPRTGFWSFLPPQKVDASHPYYWAAFQLIGPWD